MKNELLNLSLNDLYRNLNTSERGISSTEAQKRLIQYGYNEPARKQKINVLIKFLLEFTSPLIFVLLLIALVSYFAGEKITALLIAIMAFVGVVVSFIQEYRAEKDSEKLSEMIKIKVSVYRDGELKTVDLKEVVPGDVVKLSAGIMIPGDLKIIVFRGLYINESALTGESFPIEKTTNKNEDIAYMGSNVISGTGFGLIVATGLKTQFGKLSAELAKKEEKTDFDQGILKFVSLMLKTILILVLVIFIINFIAKGDFLEVFLFSLAVAVGLVPEMLPLMVAVNLSKGAIKMSQKKVIVKKLKSIQNVGAMDILCTDKTGTLTLDNITLIKHCDIAGSEDEDVLKYAYLNSFYQTGLDNILDKAILKHDKPFIKIIKKIDEIPFDYIRKVMSVIIEEDGQYKIITKGTPEVIFQKCRSFDLKNSVKDIDSEILNSLNQIYQRLSSEGFRVIALAYKPIIDRKKDYTPEDENNLIFKGFVAFLDPPKPDVAQAISGLKNLNIELKIVTGDNEQVTRKICQEVKFNISGLATGDRVEKIDDKTLAELVKETNVFTRINPLQKERIIKAIQSNNHVVGFLGDGINDAPSIKTADVGISVDNATDIAKETADIVLLQKDLHVLEDCVMEGRKTFGNIMKYIKMGASSNFGNMFSMTGASVLFPFLPLTPIQIILNNFLYDFCQITIPTDKVDREYLEKPHAWNMKFISRFMIRIGIVSSFFDFLTFGVLWYFFSYSYYQN